MPRAIFDVGAIGDSSVDAGRRCSLEGTRRRWGRMDEGFGRSFILVRRRRGGNPRYLGPSCGGGLIAQAHTAREQLFTLANFAVQKQFLSFTWYKILS